MLLYNIICGSTSLVLNTILTILIIAKSPKEMWAYRYMMLLMSISGAIHSALDVVLEPTFHAEHDAFVVFRSIKDNLFDRSIDFILISTYTGFFAFTLALYASHFVYKYASMEKEFMATYLSGYKIFFPFFVPVVCFAMLASVFAIFLKPTPDLDKYLLGKYEIQIENTSYIGGIFHHHHGNRKNGSAPEIDWKVFGVTTLFWIITLASTFIIFYFGIRCCLKIRAFSSTYFSMTTRKFHRELYAALVLQFLIFFFLVYIPIIFFFIVPVLPVGIGAVGSRISGFISYTIAAYLAVYPLPNLLVINCYFNVIRNALMIIPCLSKNMVKVVNTESRAEVYAVTPQEESIWTMRKSPRRSYRDTIHLDIN